MKEIVNWLIDMEEMAGNLYDGASKQFTDDNKLCVFLSHLAEDEGWHYHIMGSASEYLRKNKDIKSELALDSVLVEKIESLFRRSYEMLSAGTLTKESLLECILEIEYSEWNQVFIYVVNTLKQRSREFMYVESRIQNHIDEITIFFKSLPDSEKYIDRIKSLPKVWERKILIAEDNEPIRILIKSLIEAFGTVEAVDNGKDALFKVNNSFFDVIISDIEMPLLNGIDFCKEAMIDDPGIVSRIIYCSASHNDEYMKFINNNNIHLLIKPINIIDIRNIVKKILNQPS